MIRAVMRDLPAIVDYTLARRATLSALKTGLVSRDQLCDAHPDLIRSARNQGIPAGFGCPVCQGQNAVHVWYVFGKRLNARNGRLIKPETLETYIALEGVTCYVVEVCVDCAWNHISRSYVGRAVVQRQRRTKAGPAGAGSQQVELNPLESENTPAGGPKI